MAENDTRNTFSGLEERIQQQQAKIQETIRAFLLAVNSYNIQDAFRLLITIQQTPELQSDMDAQQYVHNLHLYFLAIGQGRSDVAMPPVPDSLRDKVVPAADFRVSADTNAFALSAFLNIMGGEALPASTPSQPTVEGTQDKLVEQIVPADEEIFRFLDTGNYTDAHGEPLIPRRLVVQLLSAKDAQQASFQFGKMFGKIRVYERQDLHPELQEAADGRMKYIARADVTAILAKLKAEKRFRAEYQTPHKPYNQ